MESDHGLCKTRETQSSFFKRIIDNIKSLGLPEWVILIISLLFGSLFVLTGLYLIERDHELFGIFLNFIGSIFFQKIILAVIDKSHFHGKLIKIVKSAISDKFDDIFWTRFSKSMKSQSLDIVKLLLQKLEKIEHIYESGIVDVFEGLQLERIFKKCRDTEILIQRLYFSPKEFALLKNHIKDLILKYNCKFKILLLSPDSTGIIQDRVENCQKYKKAIGYRVKDICADIRYHISELKKIVSQLPKDRKKYLEVKVYSSYPPAAITGYDDVIITGIYLSDEFADEGFQIKRKGRNKRSYCQWYDQFCSFWNANKEYRVRKNETRRTGANA